MKALIILFFSLVTSAQSKAQNSFPPIYFNGIDTFIIGDHQSKYYNAILNNRLTKVQTDTLQKHIVTYYAYNRDSLIPYRIDSIDFRNMIFTFSDSILACVDLSKMYFTKDYENAVEYVEKKMHFLKSYISKRHIRKGKAKNFYLTDTYMNYGYEWIKGDYSIILNMQFDIPKSRTVSLDLYISNKKLNDYF